MRGTKGFRNAIAPTRLENFFPQSGTYQFNGQRGSFVFVIQQGVDLDDIHGDQPTGVADVFHDEVRLAIAEAAAYRRADARRLLRVQRVQIEAQVDGAIVGDLQRLLHHAV